MPDTEKEKTEMANAAKSEEKVRVYTELGLSKNPSLDQNDSDFVSIKSYFADLLKQKHVSARINAIKKENISVNNDPHFSQFLHEAANSNSNIATEAATNLINHKITNANHDLLANVVAALIFESDTSKLNEWGSVVNKNLLTDQGAQLWLKGKGQWKETSVFKRVTYKLSDHLQNPNDVTLLMLLKSWGLDNPSASKQFFDKVKELWKMDMKIFLAETDVTVRLGISLVEYLSKMNKEDQTYIMNAFTAKLKTDKEKTKIQKIFGELKQNK